VALGHPPDRGAGAVYRGIERTRELWTVFRTEVEDFNIELRELRCVDRERVLLLAVVRFRGRASGIELESPFGQLFTLRDHKIVRAVDYLSHEDALEAVGLSE